MADPGAPASLILGASRGLGLGLVEELLGRGRKVIATARTDAPGSALRALQAKAGGNLEIEIADLAVPETIAALHVRLEGRPLDILLICGGVSGQGSESYEAAFFHVMRINALGAITALKTLSDRVQPDGALAVMSSILGSIAANTSGDFEPYRSSKAALNQSLRSFAAESKDAPWSFTAVHPGWVKTDMGGPGAPLDVATSVRGVADVLISRLGARGAAFIDYSGQSLPW
jgi:NAD(P)-dependent dehydrogenase (short-subunit alcohol dehydrogenase family)